MVTDPDIWLSAGTLVQRHGQQGAWVAAVARVSEFSASGDT